jgi:hypothetical protein
MGNDDAPDKQPDRTEGVNKAKGLLVICYARFAPPFASLDIPGADNDDDLYFIFQPHQHPRLAVRLKPREDAAGMGIVKQFAAELQIEFAAELLHPLHYPARLQFEIFSVVKRAAGGAHVFLPNRARFVSMKRVRCLTQSGERSASGGVEKT